MQNIVFWILISSSVCSIGSAQNPDTLYYYNQDATDSVACLVNPSGGIYFQLKYTVNTDTNRMENFYQSIIPTIGMGSEDFMTRFMAQKDKLHYCDCDVKRDTIQSIIRWNQHGIRVVMGNIEYATLISYTILAKDDMLVIRAHNIRVYRPHLAGTNNYPRIYDAPKTPIEDLIPLAEEGVLFNVLHQIEQSVHNLLRDYFYYMAAKEAAEDAED